MSATPAPESTTPAPDSDRFSLLEMSLPAWIEALLSVISAILPREIGAQLAWEALQRACKPLPAMPEWQTLPEATKNIVRAAKDAKLAEIRAAEHAPVVASATVPQVIPVVHDAPAVAPATAPVVNTTAPAAAAPVMASWSKIRRGQYAGDWGVRVQRREHEMFRAPVVGDIVLVERRNGPTQPKRVAAIVQAFDDNGSGPAWLLAVEDAPSGARATLMHAQTRQAIPTIPAAPAPVEAPAELTAPVNSELAAEDNALAQDLALAAGESAANASAQASGSLAAGTMRGVGFSTAAGYVQALANGVKAGTAETYKSTLHTQYGFTTEQIDALTVTIIAESTLPVGAGIVHEATGPGIFSLPPEQRRFKVGESKTKADVRRLLSERDFIAGAVAAGSMMQASWTGEGQSTCEAFNAKLAPLGLGHFAPTPSSAIRYAGDAVAALRGRDYDTTRLTSADLPAGINARWLVGRKLSGAAIKAGDAYGTALLVVSLHDDETISFDGDATLAATVRATYDAATAKETLRSNTLTPWLSGLLRNYFRGVKRGHVWYVPAGCADEARKLIEAIAPLWGDHELMPVTTGKDLMRSLTRGLADEIAALEKDYDEKTDAARDSAEKKARKLAAERKLTGTHGEDALVKRARDTATCTAHNANTILSKLGLVAARIEGYAATLGDDSVAGLKDRIATLRSALMLHADDTALRAEMLELT